MLKFRIVIFSLIAVGMLMALSATANAQRPNPSNERTVYARQHGPCRDPWITIAIWDYNGSTNQPAGVGDLGECNYMLYNGGSWNNYDELYRAVEALKRSSLTISMTSLGGSQARITHDAGGGFVWTQIIRFISDNGSGLISNKASVLSDNAAGLVSQTKDFRLQSTSNARVIRLGNSMVVIRKN